MKALGFIETKGLVGNIEATDAMLKAADVELKVFYGPPTATNFSGGLLTGLQAACQAACDTFAATVQEIAASPLTY